ncbi:hypothetical protein XF_1622 [Xylella fastidiosa 9a5c]|uniref:Uncharacterized protein n=1 Tax=Xylella fastidiosa (strain 9a5c) TaxID=160492 RepID=Q9PCY2_XYLFA|nr:hypothetical protein XF_1622 [Xylella fastidiosa 9a5c]
MTPYFEMQLGLLLQPRCGNDTFQFQQHRLLPKNSATAKTPSQSINHRITQANTIT